MIPRHLTPDQLAQYNQGKLDLNSVQNVPKLTASPLTQGSPTLPYVQGLVDRSQVGVNNGVPVYKENYNDGTNDVVGYPRISSASTSTPSANLQPSGNNLSKDQVSLLNTLSKTGKAGQTKALNLLYEYLSPSKQQSLALNSQKYDYNSQSNPLKLQSAQQNYDYTNQANPYKLQNLQYQQYYNTQVKPIIDNTNLQKSYGTINYYGSQGQNYTPQQVPTLPSFNGGGQSEISPEDQQAISWAQQNPNDPDAQQILQLHGLR